MKRNLHLLYALVSLAAAGALPGCAYMNQWAWRNRPYADRAPCQFPYDLPQDELVAHLNANTLQSWRSTSITIASREHISGLSGMLAVESPRNFRLIASSAFGGEVDFGSNNERFWFWTRRSEQKGIFTARHDQAAHALERFPIPFQPDWLMEVLGVVPLNAADLSLEPGSPARSPVRLVNLVSRRTSPQGDQVTKVTVVDTCHGVIREHALYDATGRIMARAILRGHFQDEITRKVLPSAIDLEWPRTNVHLTLRFRDIEVNPAAIAPQTWALPAIPNTPVIDLEPELARVHDG